MGVTGTPVLPATPHVASLTLTAGYTPPRRDMYNYYSYAPVSLSRGKKHLSQVPKQRIPRLPAKRLCNKVAGLVERGVHVVRRTLRFSRQKTCADEGGPGEVQLQLLSSTGHRYSVDLVYPVWSQGTSRLYSGRALLLSVLYVSEPAGGQQSMVLVSIPPEAMVSCPEKKQ